MAQSPLPMCHFFIVWSSVLQDGVSVSLHSLHCFLAAPPLGVNSLSGNSSAEFETEGLLFPNLKGEVSILHAWYGFHKVNSLWINSICWFLCFQLLFVIWFPFWEASGCHIGIFYVHPLSQLFTYPLLSNCRWGANKKCFSLQLLLFFFSDLKFKKAQTHKPKPTAVSS